MKLSGADDEDGSDFINANFVPGFNSKREFIVTQVRSQNLIFSYLTEIFRPGAFALNSRRLLADVLGDQLTCHRHAYKVLFNINIIMLGIVMLKRFRSSEVASLLQMWS